MQQLFVNNEEQQNILEQKLLSMSHSKNVFIASPYFTHNKFIRSIIEHKTNLKLIVKLCPSTSVAELRKLIKIKNIEIKFFIQNNFHSKIYIFDNSYIIIGSSNFTESGLSHNLEINIGIDNTEVCFEKLIDLSNSYWDMAYELSIEILDEYEEIMKKYIKSNYDIEIKEALSEFEETMNKRAKRIFSEEHKARISSSNKGKHGHILSVEHLKKMNENAIISNSKEVICINTLEQFNSLQEASEVKYGYKRGYTYISNVCKGKKEHYKGLFWRFLEDYNLLDSNQLDKLSQLISEYENNQLTKKVKTKILFESIIYDSMEIFGEHLVAIGALKKNRKTRPGQSVSTYIKNSIDNSINFVKIYTNSIEKIYFFAEYELYYQGSEVVNEIPISKSLEEIEENFQLYNKVKLGDINLTDLLWSKQPIFYKFEDNYYKNMTSIKAIFKYDKILTKKELLSLYSAKNKLNFNWEVNLENIIKSSKDIFYLKFNTVYFNKNDYLECSVNQISKENLILELGIEL